MVARDGGELQRLAPEPMQAREQGAAGELADDIAFGRRVVGAHPSPRSAAMLAAYWPGPPRKAAVPATSTLAPAATACARGLGVDAAVDLDHDVEVLLGDAVGDRLDLLQLAGDELLPAEARD